MWMTWLVTKGTSDVGDCSGITVEFGSGVSQEVLEDAVWKLQNFGGVKRYVTSVRQRIFFCGSSVEQQRYNG